MDTTTLYIILQIVISAAVALVAVNWIYFKILKVAKEKNIVDNPNARKLQKSPVPILGGIAVFFGVVVGVLTGATVFYMLEGAPLYKLAPVLCAMMIMIYVGALDDVIGLSPLGRIVVEVFTVLGIIFAGGGCIDSFHGLWGIESFSWWIAVPLTVFAGVGIINAINMVDGVNGLSSGLCIACSAMYGTAFLLVGDQPNAILAFTMAASLLPFLMHNVFGNKSRMFIGDAGTMMMGIMLVWFTISVLRSDSSLKLLAIQKNVNMIAMSLAIMSVPVFDTVRVMVQRMVHGKSPFHPDKTHLHHVLIRAGVSHSITAMTEVLIDVFIVGMWFLCTKLGGHLDFQLYLVVGLSVLLVWGLYFFIRRQEEKHTKLMHKFAKMNVRTHFGSKAWWIRIRDRLDAPEKKYAVVEEEEEEAPVSTGSTPEEFYHFDKLEEGNSRQMDRKKVFDYMKGKAEVYVDDIKERSGAKASRVDSFVQQGIEDGFIIVVKEGVWSAPEIVTLKE